MESLKSILRKFSSSSFADNLLDFNILFVVDNSVVRICLNFGLIKEN